MRKLFRLIYNLPGSAYQWNEPGFKRRKEGVVSMRHASVTISTRDVLLGQVYEECRAKRNKREVSSTPVSLKLLNKVFIDRLLDDLEREYDAKL